MLMLIKLLQLYSYVVLAAVIISWLPSVRDSSFGQFVLQVTEPVFALVRRVVPPMGGLDLAPLIVLLFLRFLTSALVR